MNRRDFLSALGIGSGATALAGCGWDDNRYYTPIEKILPFVTRPEQTTPGIDTKFATSIGTGPRAWPVVAVHRDGRVINVGANRLAPLPPGVPAAHFYELQRHYAPDRLRGPTKGGAPVTWESATAELASAVQAARAGGRKVAFLSRYRSGTLVELLQTFTGNSAHFWEAAGYEAEALAARALFGPEAGLPRYNLREAQYILSFGAEFLGDGWGTVETRTAFAEARHPNQGKGVARFVLVGPHRDQTGANADEWLACTPGTEAQVALAIARSLAELRGYQGPARAMLDTVDLDAVATASGVPKATLQRIASIFGSGGAVALPGGVIGASTAATELAAAVFTLNFLADQRNLFSGGGYRGPISSTGDLKALMAEMEGGAVGVLIVDDLDPVYALPSGSPASQALPGGAAFAAAMKKVGLAVVTSSHPSETVPHAALVLPTHDVFEDWGDEEPFAGFRVVRQPGMLPLYDTRSLGDLLLDVWRQVDPSTAPVGTWREVLQTRWAALQAGAAVPVDGAEAPAVDPTDALNDVLVKGYVESPVETRIDLIGAVPISGAGKHSGSGAYYLQVFPHPHVIDGRYANEPWAWEVPEPMTGQVWDTWALIHPETAAALGVGDNDLVKITTDAGSIELGVEVHPLVRKDVVAIPLGGGHTAASGRYADGVGRRVADLLAPVLDGSGAFAWQQAKCTLEKTGAKADLVSLYGDDHDQGRNIAVVVDAEKWAQVKDAEQDHPGSLTGIHHPPMDSRLVAAEAAAQKADPDRQPEKLTHTNFYPVPDHPNYRFAMTIDTNSCNGCGACMVACYAENNLAVVGKWKLAKRRQMSWIRLDRFFGEHTEEGGTPSVHFIPVPCQQCGKAPCEAVCPVLATYHTIDGLNAMIYNRCVGTRYCANACPYSARRFNYHSYEWPEPFQLQLNPEVTARTMGVMEKCTFCVQRIRKVKHAYRDQGFTSTVPNQALEQLTACADACPSQAIHFGNLLDATSVPAKSRKSARNYLLFAELGTFPAINYLARASFYVHRPEHGGGHDGATETHASPAHEAGGH